MVQLVGTLWLSIDWRIQSALAGAQAYPTPIGVCGGGKMYVIDKHRLKFGGHGKTYATIYLLYDGSRNCVVTWKSREFAGSTRLRVEAYLQVEGSPTRAARDRHPYLYAGPVIANAAKKCIKWGGRITLQPRPGHPVLGQRWLPKNPGHCGA
ncbi:hypothetical protein EDD27_4448 [Nonomuraea polychroma]|uniref:Uncharacterized protein n=1 Tax=Nonomuraea polychroma TaxID=46176 RepID=A0A438M848_9ACTN|nr:hypothetical protein [Nonomuraea polychroma]RVX41866.1 hypothetical protein EDD27_4448 [Nonomuraea polychroma]